MADARSAAIAATVMGRTFYNPIKANSFANELLSHERTLLPGAARGTPISQQIQQLSNNSGFINKLASAWDRNPAILDNLSSQLNSDPQLLARFRASMVEDGRDGNLNTTSSRLDAYIASPTVATLRRLYPQPAAAPAPRREAPAAQAPRREVPVAAPRRAEQETPAPRREAPAAPRPVVEPAAAAASTGQGISPEVASLMTKTAITSASRIFGDEFSSEQTTLFNRLDSDPALRQRIADAINRDPQLRAQLEGSGANGAGGIDAMLTQYDQQTPQVQEGIRNALRPLYRDLLNNPEKIGDRTFRDQLSSSAQSGGMMAGINGFMQKIFGEGFDISKIGQGIMSFIQPLIDMLGNLFKGFKASGGELSNVLSMGNGPGLSVPFLSQLGAAISSNENYINAEGRAVDRNRDGKFSDGMVFNPDGTPKMVAATNPDGSPRLNSNGSPVMQQEYNEALDDRITVKGQKVFEISGISDGQVNGSVLRAYATKVDMNSGQIVRSEIINIGPNGEAVVTDPDTGQIRQPAGPAVQPTQAPANQDPANRNQPGLNQTPTPPTTEFGGTGIY